MAAESLSVVSRTENLHVQTHLFNQVRRAIKVWWLQQNQVENVVFLCRLHMNTTSLRLSAERRDTMTSARPTGCFNVSLQWYPPLPCLSGVRLQPQQIHLTCRESQLCADVSATMPWMWWEVVGCVSHFLVLQTFLFTLHEVVWLLCEPRQWKHHSYLQQLLLWLDV